MMINIYVCGNPLVKDDSLPLRILSTMRKKNPNVAFIEFDPTEDLPCEKEFVCIDTVINAKDVLLLTDIDTFVATKALSLHDFDLGLNLKLAKKMGWLKEVKIIGVPPRMPAEEAVEKIGKIIASLAFG
ncbi:hypothetical protein HY772_04495 [Candidatus Woesearchaeota archaeon]|nr:hypothetical protein [Candidatus Woesearchaeota archaeon]